MATNKPLPHSPRVYLKVDADAPDNTDAASGPKKNSEYSEQEMFSFNGQSTPSLPNQRDSIKRSKSNSISFLDLWALELAAAIFSILCLFAIVAVLIHIERHSLLDEWPLKISATALVSFLATLSKSSSLLALTGALSQLKWLHFTAGPQKLLDLDIFDEASRGPWGALKLVLLKHTHTLLASAASVVIVISLLVDPFAQLTFKFPLRSDISTESAFLPVANAYDLNTTSASAYGPTPLSLPLSLQGGLLNAAFGTTPVFNASCPTSNCTWPDIFTLGVCAQCMDVTSQLAPANCTTNTTMTICSVTTPQVTVLSYESIIHDVYGGETVWMSNTKDVTGLYTDGPQRPGVKPLVAVISTIKGPNNASIPIGQEGTIYNDCSLTFCLKHYKSPNMTNGIFELGASDDIPLNFVDTGNATRIGYESSIVLQPESNDLDSLSSQIFPIARFELSNIIGFLADLFQTNYANVGRSGLTSAKSGFTPDIGLALYEGNDINTTLHIVANTLTESMRTVNLNNTQLNGTSFSNRTHVMIQWEWLLLPFILGLSSLLLLVAVIFRTRAHNLDAWKSSNLPLLFLGLDGWEKHERGHDSVKELKGLAGSMRGRVQWDRGNRAIIRHG